MFIVSVTPQKHGAHKGYKTHPNCRIRCSHLVKKAADLLASLLRSSFSPPPRKNPAALKTLSFSRRSLAALVIYCDATDIFFGSPSSHIERPFLDDWALKQFSLLRRLFGSSHFPSRRRDLNNRDWLPKSQSWELHGRFCGLRRTLSWYMSTLNRLCVKVQCGSVFIKFIWVFF